MQEGALTWSLRRNSFRHSGPKDPSGLIAFGRFIFASFFVMCFYIVFSCFFYGFRLLFWRHVGVTFHVFCITFSSIDFTRICHQLCKELYIFFEVFLLISVVLRPIGETFKNTWCYLLSHSLHFRRHMFFHNFRDMFRCSLFA